MLFYKEKLSRTRVTNNILKTFKASKAAKVDGLSWYYEANEFATELSLKSIGRRFDNGILSASANNTKVTYSMLTKYHIAGIIAALSPLQNWQRNKELAALFIEHLETGKDLNSFPYMKGQVNKALMIAQCNSSDVDLLKETIKSILGGEKTKAFFENIAAPHLSESVTIDRHALSIALGKKLNIAQFSSHTMTKKQYTFFVDCYKRAAEKIGINALALQAQTWEYWRVNGSEYQRNLNNLLNLKD